MPRLVDTCDKCFVVVKHKNGRYTKRHIEDVKDTDDVVLSNLTLYEAHNHANKFNWDNVRIK